MINKLKIFFFGEDLTPEQRQLKEWVKGNSIHDHENNVHVPDMSCCIPELQVDKRTRKAYVKAFNSGDMQTVYKYNANFMARFAAASASE